MALSTFTRLSVGNAALGRLGELPVTEIVDSAGKDAKVRSLAREWPFALDELLRAFPWNWAKARATLDQISATPLFEWSYQYELPLDHVTLLALNETDVGRAGDWWEIESGVLLTDEDTAEVEYIYTPSESATDAFVDRMDPLARNALVTLLASRIAPSVTKDGGTKAQALYGQYLRVDLAQARLRAAGESKSPWSIARTDSAWDAARYSGPNG